MLRSIGSVIAHSSIAWQATLKGMTRLRVNPAAMQADLDQAWEVLGEAVQTVMRKHGMDEPYEKLKAATRGRSLDASTFSSILDDLGLPASARAELDGLTPASYTGIAASLARTPR